MNTNNHAIVIGGSVAGMAAAQALSKHFKKVTVLERDTLPDQAGLRKGVPQDRHPHALLLRGLADLEQLFPAFRADLVKAGAVTCNFGNQIKLNIFGRWRVPQFKSALEGVAVSRPIINHTLRQRIEQNPKISLLQAQPVVGLVIDQAGGGCSGVRVRNGEHQEIMEADLVVDASGRDSDAIHWLAELGIAAPVEQMVSANPGYATRIYESMPTRGWQMMYVMPFAPKTSRGGIIMPMGDGRWIVTLIGMNGDHPPTDEAGFMEFARSMHAPELYETIAAAKPAGPIAGYRRGDNVLRCFHSAEAHLDNFLLLGDAVYALNPVYGQGMTVAASSAVLLDKVLQQWMGKPSRTGMAREWQHKLWGVINPAWMMATGEDRRWSTAKAAAPDRATKVFQAYFDRVLHATNDDAVVAEAFNYVQNMLKGPFSLLAPNVLWRVLRHHNPSTPAQVMRTATAQLT